MLSFYIREFQQEVDQYSWSKTCYRTANIVVHIHFMMKLN